jgi:ethanolamine ammonia-lyase large subunit
VVNQFVQLISLMECFKESHVCWDMELLSSGVPSLLFDSIAGSSIGNQANRWLVKSFLASVRKLL